MKGKHSKNIPGHKWDKTKYIIRLFDFWTQQTLLIFEFFGFFGSRNQITLLFLRFFTMLILFNWKCYIFIGFFYVFFAYKSSWRSSVVGFTSTWSFRERQTQRLTWLWCCSLCTLSSNRCAQRSSMDCQTCRRCWTWSRPQKKSSWNTLSWSVCFLVEFAVELWFHHLATLRSTPMCKPASL